MRIRVPSFFLPLVFMVGCVQGNQATQKKKDEDGSQSTSASNTVTYEKFAAAAAGDCVDPDLDRVLSSETITLCDGTIGQGRYEVNIGALPDERWVAFGEDVGSSTGSLKINCRNSVGVFDYASGLSVGLSGTLDAFSTVDAENNEVEYPETNPWGSDGFFCGFNGPISATWQRIVTTPATAGNESIFEDMITGLKWSRGTTVGTFQWDDEVDGNSGDDDGALEYCDELSHGGLSDWRVPTQKELMAAYIHGVTDLSEDNTAVDNLGSLDDFFWSSTHRVESGTAPQSWATILVKGTTADRDKTDTESVICVSD